MQFLFKKTGAHCFAFLIGCWLVSPVMAQNQFPEAAAGNHSAEIIVNGNASAPFQTIDPAQSLQGTELLLRQGNSLGDNLSGLPGVSSTYFGPNAGRPVIHGLGGERTPILQNSASMFDLSGLSDDHAVPVNPVALDRVDLIRGPPALLLSGNAASGVLNLSDNHINRQPMASTGETTGRLDSRIGLGNSDRQAAFAIDTGDDRLAAHVDAFDQKNGRVNIPLNVNCLGQSIRQLCNSAAQS
jgi:iron complex outermembrane receptor protein